MKTHKQNIWKDTTSSISNYSLIHLCHQTHVKLNFTNNKADHNTIISPLYNAYLWVYSMFCIVGSFVTTDVWNLVPESLIQNNILKSLALTKDSI